VAGDISSGGRAQPGWAGPGGWAGWLAKLINLFTDNNNSIHVFIFLYVVIDAVGALKRRRRCSCLFLKGLIINDSNNNLLDYLRKHNKSTCVGNF
jgi:hypothetical protein